MQLKVLVGKKEFTTLLDTGSTHNFMSKGMVFNIGVQLEPRIGLRVKVANRDQVSSSGIARNLTLSIAGHHTWGTVAPHIRPSHCLAQGSSIGCSSTCSFMLQRSH